MLASVSDVTMRPNRAAASPAGSLAPLRMTRMFARKLLFHSVADFAAASASPPASRARRSASAASQAISGAPKTSDGRPFFRGPLVAVDGLLDVRLQGFDHVRRKPAAQRADHFLRDQFPRAKGGMRAVDPIQRVWIVRDPPVPLEALGGYARAQRATVEQPLGEPSIVAIQKCPRVGAERVNLQETRRVHDFAPG